MKRFILVFFIIIVFTFSSCEKEKYDVITNHRIINFSNKAIDTLIFQGYIRFYDIKQGDSTDLVSLVNAYSELNFEFFSDDYKYGGYFNWSQVIDPVDPILTQGCYFFYILSLDSIKKNASIASKREIGCKIIK
jgi:hypothetical protein